MTNGPVMSLVEMLNSQFPVTKPQPVTEADMTPEEIKLAEIFEAKQAEEAKKAEEIVSETPSAEVKTEELIKEVKPTKKTRKARYSNLYIEYPTFRRTSSSSLIEIPVPNSKVPIAALYRFSSKPGPNGDGQSTLTSP